jgi:hypothetical protein
MISVAVMIGIAVACGLRFLYLVWLKRRTADVLWTTATGIGAVLLALRFLHEMHR